MYRGSFLLIRSFYSTPLPTPGPALDHPFLPTLLTRKGRETGPGNFGIFWEVFEIPNPSQVGDWTTPYLPSGLKSETTKNLRSLLSGGREKGKVLETT